MGRHNQKSKKNKQWKKKHLADFTNSNSLFDAKDTGDESPLLVHWFICTIFVWHSPWLHCGAVTVLRVWSWWCSARIRTETSSWNTGSTGILGSTRPNSESWTLVRLLLHSIPFLLLDSHQDGDRFVLLQMLKCSQLVNIHDQTESKQAPAQLSACGRSAAHHHPPSDRGPGRSTHTWIT